MPPRRRTTPRSDLHRALGEAVEELRKEAGLTHEELASRLEMSFQRISELERGLSNPTFETLDRLAEGFGIGLTEFARRIERRRR